MVGWRAAGARAVLRRLGAAAEAAAKQDGRVFAASYSSSTSSANAPFGLGACLFAPRLKASFSYCIDMHGYHLTFGRI